MSDSAREQRIKPEFVIERQGRKAVLYAGLLHLAHEDGLKGITVTLVQCPSDLNGQRAICSASVEMPHGVFCDVGDADPTNVSTFLVPHLTRMAATRAKARALRDALDIGYVAAEELHDVEALGGADRGGARTASPARTPGVVTRAQERINQDNGRTGAGVGTAAPRPAGPGPYNRGGVAGDPGPLEAPNWPAVPDGTPADGVIGPTPKQRETLHKFGVREIPEGMTRKEASDLITQKIEEAEARRQGR